MLSKVRVMLAAFLACACLLVAAVAWAAETLIAHASFNPDRLGAPTNLSATAKFVSTTGAPPSPITKLVFYGPAGLTIDSSGAGTCTAAKLEAIGPSGCPADSRAGFGGGEGLIELAKEIIREPYTLDFFFGPRENGHLVLLAYVHASTPASFELVLAAKEIHAPKPYGIGFSVDVPLIPTLPEASDASVESAFLTFGSTNVAYYKTVHGKKTLFHVRGVVVPKTCPRGGFASEATIDFADGTTLTVKPTIPCPRK
ncbi:MAG TPA: hypothetical protein VES65_05350 [Solirubrobacteraceae bacterium]|nr:hypothetical protein [Solirubrobacteraceae bacterium]